MNKPKKKRNIMLRMSDEEYLAIRDAALSRNQAMAEVLMDDCVRPNIPLLKRKKPD